MSQLQPRVDEKGNVVFNFGAGTPIKTIPGYQYYSKEVLLAEERRRKEAALREKEEERMNALKAPDTKLSGLENAGADATSFPVAAKPKGRRRPKKEECRDNCCDMEIETGDNDNNSYTIEGQPQFLPDSLLDSLNF